MMKRVFGLVVSTLLCCGFAMAQNTTVYLEQGGGKLVVLSGGEIEIQSGGTLDLQSGATVGQGATTFAGDLTLENAETISNSTNNSVDVTAAQLNVDGSATGSTLIILKDFDAADDDDNVTLTANCTTATTGAEDCDLAIASQTAGAAATRINIDADAEITFTSNEVEVDGQAAGNTALIFKDFDAADDDDNASLTVACTDATTGAEDCDVTLASQVAGTPTSHIVVDADGSITATSLQWVITLQNGAFPAATCVVGEIFLDTDEGTDTNCTTTADNSLCLCTATNTWTALENN